MADIAYYIIDKNSLTIMFTDAFTLGSNSNLPSQLYVDRNDYRYNIIKSEIEKQSEKVKTFDPNWFQVPALTTVKGFEVDIIGNVSFSIGAVEIKDIDKRILKNLVDYYDTPIYDMYVSRMEAHNWIISNDDYSLVVVKKDKTVTDLIVHNTENNGVDSQLCKSPYIRIDKFSNIWKDLSYLISIDEASHLNLGLEDSVIKFERTLEKFWKCEKSKFNEVSDTVKRNQKVFEKLVNTLNTDYDIEPSIIPFIAENCTDIVKMDNLLLTGMITEKNNSSQDKAK